MIKPTQFVILLPNSKLNQVKLLYLPAITLKLNYLFKTT